MRYWLPLLAFVTLAQQYGCAPSEPTSNVETALPDYGEEMGLVGRMDPVDKIVGLYAKLTCSTQKCERDGTFRLALTVTNRSEETLYIRRVPNSDLLASIRAVHVPTTGLPPFSVPAGANFGNAVGVLELAPSMRHKQAYDLNAADVIRGAQGGVVYGKFKIRVALYISEGAPDGGKPSDEGHWEQAQSPPVEIVIP